MPLMFLNGTGMSGQATHWIVGDSPLVATTSTAPRYRFHAVGGAYPALEDLGSGSADGVSVVELGVIELADGSGSFAMILRRHFVNDELTDISTIGGAGTPASWREYQAQKEA
jgi:hypothetical protein